MKSRSQTIAVLCIFVALVVLFLLFTLWASIWIDPTLGPMRPHSLKADQIANAGNLGSLLQGTLGVATGLAGAVVAVSLALLAYRIAENEKYREDFRFVNERLEVAVKPIIFLARALSSLYALLIESGAFREDLRTGVPYKNLGGESVVDSEAPVLREGGAIMELPYKGDLAEGQMKLAEALEAILLDSFSLKLFIAVARRRRDEGRLFVMEDLNKPEPTLDEDLPDFPRIIQMWARKLREQAVSANWGEVMAPYRTAQSLKDGKGKAIKHVGVKSFIELGYELRLPFKRNKGVGVDQSGPVLLFNLAQCIPQGIDDLATALDEMFRGTLSRELKERSPLLAFFRSENRSLWLGRATSDAVKWIEEHSLEYCTFEKSTISPPPSWPFKLFRRSKP